MTEQETKLVEALREARKWIKDDCSLSERTISDRMEQIDKILVAYDAGQSSGQTIPAREEDGELVEQAARAMYEGEYGDKRCKFPPWEKIRKDYWLRLAGIAAAALSRPHASHPEQIEKLTKRVEWLESLFDFSDPEVTMHHAPNDPITKDACVVRASDWDKGFPSHPEQANAAESVTESVMEFVQSLALGADDPPEGGFDETPPSWAIEEDWHMYGAKCGYCGCWLSIVRPGKEQCDWCEDGRNMAVRARAALTVKKND